MAIVRGQSTMQRVTSPILVARRIPVASTTRNAAAVAWGEPTGHGKICGGARDG